MTEEERILKLCAGNEAAAQFLALWGEYCHALDDIVDGDDRSSEHLIRTCGFLPIQLCTHPFFLSNPAITVALRQVMLLVANAYADSVCWERSPDAAQRAHADVLRHCGNEMVFAVAQICGGYDHARSISLEQRALCCVNNPSPQPTTGGQ